MIEFEKSDEVLITENLYWENSKLWDSCPTKKPKKMQKRIQTKTLFNPKES